MRVCLLVMIVLSFLRVSLSWAASSLSYEDFLLLPPGAQNQLIHTIQDLLVQMDPLKARDHKKESAFSSSLWQLICEASANDNTSASFCINLGVVKPVNPDETVAADQCVQGPDMHNFDTSQVLSTPPFDLGDTAKGCSGGSLPCSPFFGFAPDGGLLCTGGGSSATATCRSKGKNAATTLAEVLVACASGAASSPKIKCDGLKAFYLSQLKTVGTLCKGDSPYLACGILNTQIAKDQAMIQNCSPEDIKKIDAYLNDVSAGPPSADAQCIAKAGPPLVAIKPDQNKVSIDPGSEQVASSVRTQPPNNPPGDPAQAQVATQAPTQADSACTQLRAVSTSNYTFNNYIQAMFKGAPSSAVCAKITLPNGSIMSVNRQATATIDKKDRKTAQFVTDVEIQPVHGALVTLNQEEIYGVTAVSNKFSGPPFYISLSDPNLLAYYLPMAELPDVSITDAQNKKYPSKQYQTDNGTILAFSSSTRTVSNNQCVMGQVTNAPGGKAQTQASIYWLVTPF